MRLLLLLRHIGRTRLRPYLHKERLFNNLADRIEGTNTLEICRPLHGFGECWNPVKGPIVRNQCGFGNDGLGGDHHVHAAKRDASFLHVGSNRPVSLSLMYAS